MGSHVSSVIVLMASDFFIPIIFISFCHCFDGFSFFYTHHCFLLSLFWWLQFFWHPSLILFLSIIVLMASVFLTPNIIFISFCHCFDGFNFFETHHHFCFFLSLLWCLWCSWHLASFSFLSVIVLMASGFLHLLSMRSIENICDHVRTEKYWFYNRIF